MGSHSQLSKKKTAMSSIETLSPGVAQSGVADQYADGVAAQNWLLYIGEQENRTSNYKNFLINTLKEKKCYTILDAAAGTGVDSVMLIEEMGQIPAFSLTSCDYSDKMLKYALKLRWERRREQAFFDWTIEEGNWMTLPKDVKTPGAGYDLIIDHRNYDYILKNGKAPKKNIYSNSQNIKSIKTQIIYEDNKPRRIVLDYKMDVEGDGDFVLSYQPWTLAEFSSLLKGIFGSGAAHTTYADFFKLSEVVDPAFYIHVIEKPGSTRRW